MLLLAAALLPGLRLATSSIVVTAGQLELVINGDCTAAARWQGSQGDAVPFVSMYNKVIDNHASTLEPCMSAEVQAGAAVAGVAGTSTTRLVVTAAHNFETTALSPSTSSHTRMGTSTSECSTPQTGTATP